MCVFFGHISPLECLFILKILSHTQRATDVQKFVSGTAPDPSETALLKRTLHAMSNGNLRNSTYDQSPHRHLQCGKYYMYNADAHFLLEMADCTYGFQMEGVLDLYNRAVSENTPQTLTSVGC